MKRRVDAATRRKNHRKRVVALREASTSSFSGKRRERVRKAADTCSYHAWSAIGTNTARRTITACRIQRRQRQNVVIFTRGGTEHRWPVRNGNASLSYSDVCRLAWPQKCWDSPQWAACYRCSSCSSALGRLHDFWRCCTSCVSASRSTRRTYWILQTVLINGTFKLLTNYVTAMTFNTLAYPRRNLI